MDTSNEDRFYLDLEFIQLLCNAKYLQYLAQHGYLNDSSFLNYLKYLQYWKTPKYTQYLHFPQCLAFLDALIESQVINYP